MCFSPRRVSRENASQNSQVGHSTNPVPSVRFRKPDRPVGQILGGVLLGSCDPERVTRIERAGSSLARKHSTLEKHPHRLWEQPVGDQPGALCVPWSWLRESNPLGRAYQARAPPQEPSQRESDQRDSDPRKLEWKSSALPLGHGRVELATGIEPAKTRVQTGGTTVVRRQRAKDRPCQGTDAVPLVELTGDDPATSRMQTERSPK